MQTSLAHAPLPPAIGIHRLLSSRDPPSLWDMGSREVLIKIVHAALFLVRAAFCAAELNMPSDLFVRTAFCAARLRSAFPRRVALACACLERAFLEAAP